MRAEVNDVSPERIVTHMGFGAVGGAMGNVGSLAAKEAAMGAGRGAMAQFAAGTGASFAASKSFETVPRACGGVDRQHQEVHMAKQKAAE